MLSGITGRVSVADLLSGIPGELGGSADRHFTLSLLPFGPDSRTPRNVLCRRLFPHQPEANNSF